MIRISSTVTEYYSRIDTSRPHPRNAAPRRPSTPARPTAPPDAGVEAALLLPVAVAELAAWTPLPVTAADSEEPDMDDVVEVPLQHVSLSNTAQ